VFPSPTPHSLGGHWGLTIVQSLQQGGKYPTIGNTGEPSPGVLITSFAHMHLHIISQVTNYSVGEAVRSADGWPYCIIHCHCTWFIITLRWTNKDARATPIIVSKSLRR